MALIDELRLKDFAAIMRDSVAAVQSAGARLLDFTVGSSLRAVLEASAGIGLWMQGELLRVAAATRLASSSGEDVDSFVADYGLPRLAAVPASGMVTFARFSPGLAAAIPVGSAVRTADLTQSFLVYADTAHPRWSPEAGVYILPPGVASADLPVRAATPGAEGNVTAGAVTLAGTALPGVDTVINALPMTGGDGAETDAELKARFPAFIGSLSKATRAAIEAAIQSVQQGLTFRVAVNQDETGAWRPGHFVVTFDDGSGAPPADLVARVSAAVDGVRAIGETFSVHGPAAVPVDVALTVILSSETDRAAITTGLRDAVAAYVATLPVGATLPASRIAAVAYGVSPGIANVSAVRLNGGPDDIEVPAHGRVVLSSVTVS